MRNLKIGAALIATTAALTLGGFAAAPASADEVGILATGEFRDINNDPTGDIESVCSLVPDDSVVMDLQSGSVSFYALNDTDCSNPLVTLTIATEYPVVEGLRYKGF